MSHNHIHHSKQSLDIRISDEIFKISVDGAMQATDVSTKISSVANGNWKKIISMQYNNVTGEIQVVYEE